MGTIRDMSATSPRLFKDSWGRTRNPRNKFISPHCDPTSGNEFSGKEVVNKKRQRSLRPPICITKLIDVTS